jgi:MULE transposase domain
MESSIMFARPVMSLDACHLKSQWKETLYAASVLTAMDNVYPVAFAVTESNEDFLGWQRFLCNSKECLQCLSTVPPGKQRPKFSFVSDRDKGLEGALEEEFPNNHSFNCAVHIQRNVLKYYGKVAAEHVVAIAKSYSTFKENFYFDQFDIGVKKQKAALDYLLAIENKRWRTTAWAQDESLPPRYGIVTSNTSESLNSMFNEFRQGSWFDTVTGILNKMSDRISELRLKSKGKNGVIPKYKDEVTVLWDRCTEAKVYEINEGEKKYKVNQCSVKGKLQRPHIVDMETNTCSCGVWQDTEKPCFHLVAYLRHYEGKTVDYITTNYIGDYYKFEHHRQMMQANITPVILDKISMDKYSQPPQNKGKRQAGRPKTGRHRERSKFVIKEHSPIVCSLCNKRGHNKRSCESRKHAENNKEKKRWRKRQTDKSNQEGKDKQENKKQPD